MRQLRKFRVWLVLAASLLAPAAQAEVWRVDLILFRYLGAAEERGQTPRAPNLGGALELGNVAQLRAAGITVLPDSQFGLLDHWNHLKGSPQYKPLMKLAWTQADPPSERGPRLHLSGGAKLAVSEGNGIGVRELMEFDGSVGLNLSRYIHLDADFVYTQLGEEPKSWRLDERRRMRSEDLHHLDSPRLGLVVRVTKAAP